MTYRTHALLAEELAAVLKQSCGLSVHLRSFVEGSVKPDTTSLFLRHPHFWKYSRKWVFGRMEKLSKKKLVDGKKNKKFWTHLGIITHYLGDFFTAVHNRTPNRLMEHLAWEQKLEAQFILMQKDGSLSRHFEHLLANTKPVKRLESLIVSLHRLYKPDTSDLAIDLEYIITVCATLVYSFCAHAMDRPLSIPLQNDAA